MNGGYYLLDLSQNIIELDETFNGELSFERGSEVFKLIEEGTKSGKMIIIKLGVNIPVFGYHADIIGAIQQFSSKRGDRLFDNLVSTCVVKIGDNKLSLVYGIDKLYSGNDEVYKIFVEVTA